MLSKQCVSRSSGVSPIFPLYYHPASQKFIHLFFSISGAKVEPSFLFILGSKIDLSLIFHFRLCSSSFFSFGVYCTLIILALTWVLVVFECQEPQCNALQCGEILYWHYLYWGLFTYYDVIYESKLTCAQKSENAGWLSLKALQKKADFRWKLSESRHTYLIFVCRRQCKRFVQFFAQCVISHTVCNFTHSV